jgi:MFS family permease
VSSGKPLPLARVVVPLAIAETLIWAVTFYMFPAMLTTWEADLGWDKTQLSGGFTLALLLSAAVAPLAGRLIDRRHGRLTMAASVALASVMLIALSQVRTPLGFYIAWAGIGVAMGGALYEACFAFVTRLLGDDARRAITAITLVAGFAGTVSFPLTHWLNAALGWRNTLLVYAAIALFIIMPLILSVTARGPESELPAGGVRGYGVAEALRTPLFWLLATGFALIALEHGIIITHLLPILADKGFAAGTAVLAASMIGPMQVVGRLGMIAVQRRLSILAIAMVSVSCLAAAAVSLYLAAMVTALAFVFVLLQGAGNGVTSIARPVLTAECLGRANFGAISGISALLFMLMMALSPSIASLLWRLGGYDLVIIFVIACCAVSLGCLWGVSLIMRRR